MAAAILYETKGMMKEVSKEEIEDGCFFLLIFFRFVLV